MSVLEQNDVYLEVAQRLRLAAAEDRSFEAAQMQLINLADIIKAAGPQWPRLKDKIRTGSMTFLKGCLEEADIVIPAGDGFLIIFAGADEAQARARAEELRLLLVEFYLGEEGLRNLGLRIEHRRVSAKEIGALVAPPAPPAEEPSTHSCLFAPVWSPRSRVVASYFCFPVHRTGAGPARYGYDAGFAATGRNESRDHCALDLGLLDAVQAGLGRYAPDEPHPAIGVSVHSTTMQNRIARAAFLERLGRLPREQTKHMFVKIAEIEPGAPLINLADWAGMLRVRVPNIMFEFHHSEVMPPNLLDVGVVGAGYQAQAAGEASEAEIVPMVRQFRKWSDSLARQRLRFFVDNLRRPGLVRLAAEAGAAFVTSDAIWPFQKWPGPILDAPGPAIGASPGGGNP